MKLVNMTSRSIVLKSLLPGQRTIIMATRGDIKAEMNAISATASRLGIKIRQSRGLVATPSDPAFEVLLIDRLEDDPRVFDCAGSEVQEAAAEVDYYD